MEKVTNENDITSEAGLYAEYEGDTFKMAEDLLDSSLPPQFNRWAAELIPPAVLRAAEAKARVEAYTLSRTMMEVDYKDALNSIVEDAELTTTGMVRIWGEHLERLRRVAFDDDS